MIETAIISGQLGVAVFSQGGVSHYLAFGETTPRLSTPYDEALLRSVRVDIEFVERANLTVELVAERLAFRTRCETALSLVLCGLDSTLSQRTRSECFVSAEELLGDHAIRLFVGNRLNGIASPDALDLYQSLKVAEFSHASVSAELLQDAISVQATLRDVHEAFDREFSASLTPETRKEEYERAFVDSGAFGAFAKAVATGSRTLLATALVSASSHDALRPLRGATLLLNAVRVRVQQIVGMAKTARPADETEVPHHTYQDPILELLSEYPEISAACSKMTGLRAKEIVDKQIEGIGTAIRAGELGRADKFLMDLIQFHAQTGDKEHVAKTLCNLANIALEANSTEYAQKLVDYALALAVEDSVIYTAKAEVLRQSGRLQQALTAYKEATVRFPESHYPPCGYAEVFRDMGRYAESADAYEDAIKKFPDSVVPFSGRAEVFRSEGNFKAALGVYQKTIDKFPGEPVPHSGYVEVLKGMGRYEDAVQFADRNYRSFGFDPRVGTTYGDALSAAGKLEDALKIYAAVAQKFPDYPYSRSRSGDVLRRLGRFQDALSEYDSALNYFPTWLRAIIGKARVFMDQGDWKSAEAILPTPANMRSKEDWFAYRVSGLILLGAGDVRKATQIFEHGLQTVPWAWMRSFFATSLGLTKVRRRAKEGFQILESDLPSLEVQRQQVRLLFAGHLNAELGLRNEALRCLNQVGLSPNITIVELKDDITLLYNLHGKRKFLANRSSEQQIRQRVENRELMLAAAA